MAWFAFGGPMSDMASAGARLTSTAVGREWTAFLSARLARQRPERERGVGRG